MAVSAISWHLSSDYLININLAYQLIKLARVAHRVFIENCPREGSEMVSHDSSILYLSFISHLLLLLYTLAREHLQGT